MKTTMTSRERVWKAINFQEADRVPIDIGGTKATGIHADEYIDLGRYLGLDVEMPKVYDQFQMLGRVGELVRRRLHSDVIQLENVTETWGFENKDWKIFKTGQGNELLMPGAFNPVEDERGYLYINDKDGNTLAHMQPGGLYFDRANSTSVSDDIIFMDPEEWKNSIPLYKDEELYLLQKRAQFLKSYSDYSIHGGFNKFKMHTTGIMAGHTFSDWLCLLATEKDYIYSILQATSERIVENLNLYLQAVGDCIDTILISTTDYGSQNCELFNPEIFKELYLPNMKRVNDYVHAHSKVKTMYHSCGSIRNLIEYFIQAGVDILNPIQTQAANMDPCELKKEFSGRIVFWGGGADTQSTLPFGTDDEVREQVKERMRIFSPGGGFVFAAIHNIQYGVPPENVIAMADTAFEYGCYSK